MANKARLTKDQVKDVYLYYSYLGHIKGGIEDACLAGGTTLQTLRRWEANNPDFTWDIANAQEKLLQIRNMRYRARYDANVAGGLLKLLEPEAGNFRDKRLEYDNETGHLEPQKAGAE